MGVSGYELKQSVHFMASGADEFQSNEFAISPVSEIKARRFPIERNATFDASLYSDAARNVDNAGRASGEVRD